MPRTTLDIDASVLRELKKRQARERKTLGQLVSELLAIALASDDSGRRATPFRWVTKDLAPRVDLDDKDAVWSVLDDRTSDER
ncbi:MAG: antitoxin [Acidimicrobiia bacterium]